MEHLQRVNTLLSELRSKYSDSQLNQIPRTNLFFPHGSLEHEIVSRIKQAQIPFAREIGPGTAPYPPGRYCQKGTVCVYNDPDVLKFETLRELLELWAEENISFTDHPIFSFNSPCHVEAIIEAPIVVIRNPQPQSHGYAIPFPVESRLRPGHRIVFISGPRHIVDYEHHLKFLKWAGYPEDRWRHELISPPYEPFVQEDYINSDGTWKYPNNQVMHVYDYTKK